MLFNKQKSAIRILAYKRNNDPNDPTKPHFKELAIIPLTDPFITTFNIKFFRSDVHSSAPTAFHNTWLWNRNQRYNDNIQWWAKLQFSRYKVT